MSSSARLPALTLKPDHLVVLHTLNGAWLLEPAAQFEDRDTDVLRKGDERQLERLVAAARKSGVPVTEILVDEDTHGLLGDEEFDLILHGRPLRGQIQPPDA